MEKQISNPHLDLAWNQRKEMRLKAMICWDESNRLKKSIGEKLCKDRAVADKMRSRAPWKTKGLYAKRKNILTQVDITRNRSAELRKKGDEINSQANKLWTDMVIRECGDIKQKWVNLGGGNRVCILPNGLKFYN